MAAARPLGAPLISMAMPTAPGEFFAYPGMMHPGMMHPGITKYILSSMSSTVISVKVDSDVKEAAQEVAKSAGLTLSSLINSYLKQLVATRRIEIYAPEPMTPALEELLAEVEAELHAGKASRPFTDVDEFLADLKQ